MHARRDKKLETAPCCHGIHAPRHVGLLRVQEWCGEVAGRMAWDSAYAWIDQLQLTIKPLLELAGIAVKQLMQTRNIGKLLVRALEPIGLKVITRPPLQSPSSSGGGARLVPLERISISEVGPASLAALADHVLLFCPATTGHVPAKDYRRAVLEQQMRAALARYALDAGDT